MRTNGMQVKNIEVVAGRGVVNVDDAGLADFAVALVGAGGGVVVAGKRVSQLVWFGGIERGEEERRGSSTYKNE